ncbi:MAG: hypothetical protein ACFFBD_11485 [Candidatus Hodarchaeota archaeon]
MGKIISVFKIVPTEPNLENIRNNVTNIINKEAKTHSIEVVDADEKIFYKMFGQDIWGLEVWCKVPDDEEGSQNLENFEEALADLDEIQSCEKIGETLGK